MTPVLRIVLIEDNPDDALLVTREVEHAGYVVQAQRVQTAEELRDTLAQGTWDLVLADYSLPHFSATEGLAILWETGLDVPFIIVSGSIGEEVMAQLMKDGAADYVMKDHLPRLGPVVKRELRDTDERRRKRDTERALVESEKRYRLLVESQTDLIVKTDPEGRLLYASPTYCALFGKSPQELTTLSYQPLVYPDDLPSVEHTVADLFHPPHSYHYEERAMTVGGWRWVEWATRAELDSQGNVVALIGSGRDITDRKQIEEKLRMSELDLQQAQAVAHVGSWRWDIAHDEFAWSDEMCRIFGIAPHAFTGSVQDVIARAIHPDDRARIEESNRAIIDDHNPQPLEYRIVWPDSSVRTVWVKPGEMTLDDKGHASSLTGVVLDITERKQAGGELASSLSLLKATMESTADGILVVDLDGRITLWNHKFSDMWQIPEELLSKHLDEPALNYVLQQLAQPETFLAKVRELYGQPEASSNDQLELADGRIFRRYSQPQRIGNDVVGRVWSFSDITEHKRAEETLHNERLLLRTLIDNIPDSIYSKDLACRKTLANSTEVRYLGVKSEADVLGKDDFDVYPKELAEKFFADDQLVLQTGEPVLNREEYILDEKRQKHWLLTSKLPLRNQEGRIIGLVGIGRDITERKQAEAQLRQSQKMEAIGQLAGGVAHDFNNLLTGILGNIALMRSTLPSADPLLENLDGVETAARQAAMLTKGLLTFGRSAVVLPVPMNITAAIDATLALLKQSLPATMDIVRDDEQTAWNVLVDQSQMTQILLNLAVNARDAMKGKGTLTIRTSNEVVGEKYVQTHPFARTGEFVHLSVTDTGPGMSSEVMQHLFEPFYTTKPIGSGTGLGLSIVYGAVKQAGGWITGASTEGVGATFDIYLPRCLEKCTKSLTPSPLSENACRGMILVVEDEPVVRSVAQAFLSKSGCTILTAVDGASAIDIFKDQRANVGLVFLDMTMPGMTTDEIVQAIRALDRKVPILLNSGYTSNDTVKRMLAEGTVQGFLSKPYELHELLDTVDQLMKRT